MIYSYNLVMLQKAFTRSIIVFVLLFIFVFICKAQEFWTGNYSPGALLAASICYNTVPSSINSVAAVGGSGSFTYQWYKDQGSGYFRWRAAGTGINPNAKLTATAEVYRKATDPSTGWTANTNPVTITVGEAMNVSYTLNGTSPICSGSTTTMSITGSQSGFTYQLRDDADNTVKAIKPGTGGSISFDPVSPIANTTYNVLAVEDATSCSEELASTKAIVVEFPISDNMISSTDGEVCSGSGFTVLAMEAQGTGITYQWQKSTTGPSSGFANITGATSQNYSTSITDTTWYRRIAYSTSAVCGTSSHTSNTVQKSVIPAITNNTITTSPFTTCYNSVPAAISADAALGGSGTAAYLWEYSTAGPSSGFSAAPGSNTGQNYTPTAAITQTTWYRRRVVKGCIDYSPALQVSVYSEIALAAPTISRQGNQVGDYTQTVTSPQPTGSSGSTYYYRYTLKLGSTPVSSSAWLANDQSYDFNMRYPENSLGTYSVTVEAYRSDCPSDIATATSQTWTHAACGTTTGDGNFTILGDDGKCYMVDESNRSKGCNWGCDRQNKGTDYDNGASNTVLAAGCTAAGYCVSSTDANFSDWYLPSYNEFIILHNNRDLINMGSSEYWSSSEWATDPARYAWAANLSQDVDYRHVYGKSRTKKIVRCIRLAY